MGERLAAFAAQFVWAVLPIGAVAVVVALATGMALGGWNFTLKALAPKFGKLNPLAGLPKLASADRLIDTGCSCLLALVIGGVGGFSLRHVETVKSDSVAGQPIRRAPRRWPTVGRRACTGSPRGRPASAGTSAGARAFGVPAHLDAARWHRVLMAGMTFNELPFGGGELSLVRRMHHGGDFVIDPLPNLLFTRDSSFWIGPRVAITSLALPARVRETSLTDLIYAHHPRFLGVRRAYESRSAPVEGGDVLLLAPGVVAVGVGERTTPAGAEALARSLFDDDLAHTVLAVPIAQERAQMHLDTVCTMVDVDAVVMYPNIVDSLSAFTIHRDGRRGDDRRRAAVRRGRRRGDGHREAAGHRHRARPGDRRA